MRVSLLIKILPLIALVQAKCEENDKKMSDCNQCYCTESRWLCEINACPNQLPWNTCNTITGEHEVAHGEVKLFATKSSYNHKYVPVKAWYSDGYYWSSKKYPERYSFGFQSCEPMAVTRIKFNTAQKTDQTLVQSNGDKTTLKREYEECK